jgi:hypothetical protein
MTTKTTAKSFFNFNGALCTTEKESRKYFGPFYGFYRALEKTGRKC